MVTGTLLVGGTALLVGGATLLDGGVILLEEEGVLAGASSSVGIVWQAVNKSNSKTNANKAGKKRYFFIESQPFTKIRQ